MEVFFDYKLESNVRCQAQVQQLVERLHQKALDLPFKEVSEVIDVSDDGNYMRPNCALRERLLINAKDVLLVSGIDYSLKPQRLIAFEAWPGTGSKRVTFGLVKYPDMVEVNDHWNSRTRRLRTGLGSWRWAAYCKTWDGDSDDLETFLFCQLTVVKMLDHAANLGLLKEVSDNGDFWKERDLKAMVECVKDWNTFSAETAGRLKDAFGHEVISEITKLPNFEHLAASSPNRPEPQ